MSESLTSESVGGPVGKPPALPGSEAGLCSSLFLGFAESF
jgi:hypothetical protein